MKQYLVIKKVKLLVGEKTYLKDAIITEKDVGADKIKRYLARGYIKPVGKEKPATPEKPTTPEKNAEVDKKPTGKQ